MIQYGDGGTICKKSKDPVMPRETLVRHTSVKCAIYAVSWHLDARARTLETYGASVL
jgi:hypothetical protein